MDSVSFHEIAKDYKALFIDSYGVLKNHKGIIKGVQNSLDFIRKEDIALRVLTNDASRSQKQQIESFEQLGLKGIQEEEIITSGMLARQFLELKIKNGKIAYLGTKNSADYIIQNGMKQAPVSEIELDEIDELTAFAFLDDEGFDWHHDMNKTVNILRRKNIPVLVANSDKYYPTSSNDVAIAIGGLSRLIESVLNQKFIRFGKPDSQMFMYALEDLNRYGNYTKSDILMVGDTLHTDILGGNKFGLKTMLVLSGNTRPDNVNLKINSSGIIPDYISDSILY